MKIDINLNKVTQIARDAGRKILSYYGKEIPVDKKADNSPLTLADKAAHEYIQAALNEAYPDIPVLSEESDQDVFELRKSWSKFWLVDPLDGTKDFIKQTDCFTVNIALIDAGVPVLGVIYVPAKSLAYWAVQGQGAWRAENGIEAQKITISEPNLDSPNIVASRDHAGPEVAKLLERFPGHSCLSIGSSLKFCMVAEGVADIYLRDVPTFEWDVGAAQCIVSEAGGVVYDLRSQESLKYNKDDLRNGSLLTLGKSSICDWGI